MRGLCLKAPLCIILVFAFLGCHSYSKEKQLERVAKDWALTMRASQVIPVYPLTNDLQPGDIFLVQVPIGEETKIYSDKGFLPIDMQYARLDLSETKDTYSEFYKESYWKGEFAEVPFPRPKRRKAEQSENIGKLEVAAPSVAFPNYTFKIQTGSGLQMAIPISSVPVGLGFMESNTAFVSVDLKEAFTYGLSMERILPKLKIWANRNKAELSRQALASENHIYLRTVTRVYLVGKVNVTLRSADTKSGGVDFGKSQSIDLLALQTDDPARLEQVSEAYKKASKVYGDLLDSLSDNLPGGSIRIVQASRGSVTLEEAFDEPKVIGYAGFDVPVAEDGSIGAPIPTFEKLEKHVNTPRAVSYRPDKNSQVIRAWLDKDDNTEKLEGWLNDQQYAQAGIAITNVINGPFPEIRVEIIDHFHIPPLTDK